MDYVAFAKHVVFERQEPGTEKRSKDKDKVSNFDSVLRCELLEFPELDCAMRLRIFHACSRYPSNSLNGQRKIGMPIDLWMSGQRHHLGDAVGS